MLNIYQLVEQCQQTKSLNEKIEILKLANEDAKTLLHVTYNGLVVLNLASDLINHLPDTEFNTNPGNTIYDFTDLVDFIIQSGTMNNDIKARIVNTLKLYTKPEAIVLQNVLLKDLRIGVGEKTLNKALGKNFVPEFELMRCVPPSEKAMLKLVKNSKVLICQPKYDGQRCAMRYCRDNKEIQLLSRNGKPVLVSNQNMINEAQDLCDKLSTSLTNHPNLHTASYIWLDGEIMHESFREGVRLSETEQFEVFAKLMESKASNGDNNNIFKLFTYFVTNNNEDIGTCSEIVRMQQLKNIDMNEYDNIELIKSTLINVDDTTIDKINKYYEDCIEQGYEGAIIKNAETKYSFTRSADWLKMKPSDTADLVLTGVKEGTGKYVGQVGSLLLEGEVTDTNGNTHLVKTGCSGMNDNLRKYIWDNIGELIGRTIEIGYTSVTADNSLRHARFIRIRDDK